MALDITSLAEVLRDKHGDRFVGVEPVDGCRVRVTFSDGVVAFDPTVPCDNIVARIGEEIAAWGRD